MNNFSTAEAIFLGSFISFFTTVAGAFLAFYYMNPQKKRRLRELLKADIREMIAITNRGNFDDVLGRIRRRELTNFPKIIDASVKLEIGHQILIENVELFEPREIELLTKFFRRLKSTRRGCLALEATENLDSETIQALCDRASDDWSLVLSVTDQIEKEVFCA